MSAIAGLWRLNGEPGEADCARMLKAQALYGPDGGGSWYSGKVSLGAQLKRLLPEDRHDRQPVVAGGGRFVLVADVRLDNRAELAAALGVPGERVASMSDSALLACAWEKWEEECCPRLLGDFAFAAWDVERRRLVLARDFAGARPLHYHRSASLLAFASMPKGLHALPDVPHAPDCDYTLAALLGSPPLAGTTMFAGVHRVLPGQIIVFDERGMSERQHWRPAGQVAGMRDPREAAEGLRHHLDEAVRSHLRGVDAVGAQLSGGLDSSAVATSAALSLAGRGRVVAFTAVPREGYQGQAPYGRIGDEGPAAASIASLYPNMEHVPVHAAGLSPLANLDRDMHLIDQPAVNLCNMRWLNAINAEARRRGLSVVLTGARGNLAFSHHGLDLLPDLLRRGRLVRLAREIAALRSAGHSNVAGGLSAAIGPLVPFRAWAALGRLTGRGPLRWLHGAVNPAAAAAAAGQGKPPAPTRASRLERMAGAFRTVDLGSFYKGMLGGWGLDYRDPTGDRRLVEYCLSLPPEMFLRNGVRRAVTRDALQGRVPEAVRLEPRAGLQGVDWHEGAAADRATMRDELARAAACAPAASLIDVPRLRALVEEWPDGGWDDPATDKAYRLDLLRGISVTHFIRKASGSDA